METRRLIVNADDFGLTEGVNRGVVDGHRRGVVTSATLMANGGAFASAVDAAVLVPRLGVGVHLNLVEGRPVAPPARIPTLVDRTGAFAHAPSALAARVAAGRVSLGDVEREMRAQIERVLEAGVRPTHLDGHKHAHLAPRVFGVVVRLAREYGVYGVRCAAAASVAGAAPAKQRVRAIAVSALATRHERACAAAGLHSPSRLLGVAETGHLTLALVERMIAAPGPWPAELMCHPGYADDELAALPTRLVESRERELAVLTAPQTRAALEREGVELINYGDLGERR